MAYKSKKYRRRINKSRKVKNGGSKNNNMTHLASQMAGYNTILSQSGGQVGAAPAPAPAASACPYQLGSLDATSLGVSLQQFGDALQSFIHTAESTTLAATSAHNAITAQGQAATNLQSAATALENAFYGSSYYTSPTATSAIATPADPAVNPNGLYKLITGSTFRVSTPAPAPAP